MNDFKKNLRKYTSKNIDEKIQNILDIRLSKLEAISELDEYKQHICERKTGILNILNNFDYFICILDQSKKYTSLPKKKNVGNYKIALDNIIKREITEELDVLYKKESVSNSTNSTKASIQIFDRKIKIAELLDNYDEYMKFLESYIQEEKNSNFEQLLH